MQIALLVAKVSAPTGQLLADLLTKHGHQIVSLDKAKGVVCYGVPYVGALPALNAKAGTFDNLEQIKKLAASGVRVPPIVDDIEKADWEHMKFPMLAREAKHHGGKDIKAVMQAEEIGWRKQSGSAFFTQYIPIAEEFRAWVYRRRIKAVYKKEMKWPEKFKRIGRNFQNGFAFSFVEKEALHPLLHIHTVKAVYALGLDFGAVDIILGKDGHFYVLEVNTAPGVSEGIRQGITGLASGISRWANSGFKKQNTGVVIE